jgi:hypothetical protein
VWCTFRKFALQAAAERIAIQSLALPYRDDFPALAPKRPLLAAVAGDIGRKLGKPECLS